MSQFDRAKTPARSTPDPQDASAATVSRASEIGDRAGRLGLEIADIAGIVEDLAGLNNHLGQTLENVIDSVDRSTETNNRIRTAMGELKTTADQTRLILSKSSEQVSDTLATAIDNMQALGEGIIGITRSAEQACDTIAKVQDAAGQAFCRVLSVGIRVSIGGALAGEGNKLVKLPGGTESVRPNL